MTLKVTKKYKVSQIHLVSFLTTRLAFLSVGPIMGLPGSWTLKMTTGNLICRSTDVAYQVPKCDEPGAAGTKGKPILS